MVQTRSAVSNAQRDDDSTSAIFLEPASSSNGTAKHSNGGADTQRTVKKHEHALHPSNLPGAPKSLSGIAVRAFGLGLTLGASLLLTIYLAHHAQPLWRAPIFLAILALFHFFEFWTTATYNTQYADTSAFLLSTNGRAYNMAHLAAFFEIFLTNTNLLLNPASLWSRLRANIADPRVIAVGVVIMVLGQTVRSVAMAQAGTNFNHTVQVQKHKEHQLVTHGVYRWLRHPSYFGFFWWSVGSQVAVGNVVCAVGYAFVLGGFFRHRIMREEEYLIRFFGKEYLEFRERTPVGIPFI